MTQSKNKEHDFSMKLRQSSVIRGLRNYVDWLRKINGGKNPPPVFNMSPVSINLDLTTACNFSCPHCVDSEITNTGGYLDPDVVKSTLKTLKSHGLLSVILLGGGEPTLYREFEEIVRYIKSLDLQLGIVTNGSKLSRVLSVADVLQPHDWVRLSLDAASQDTFNKLHRPRTPTLLTDILETANKLKKLNPKVSLGYSFVIMWEGLTYNGNDLAPNLHEMADAVGLAAKYEFDYISFKPCLIRVPEVRKETLLDSVDDERAQGIIKAVAKHLETAKNAAGGGVKVLESVNLIAMLTHQVQALKNQPKTCHMQVFNSVVTPMGIFHCPAFRGVDAARIGAFDGYAGEEKFQRTAKGLTNSIISFDASKECDRIACFYNHVNWWIEDFIRSDRRVEDIEEAQDDNFFF